MKPVQQWSDGRLADALSGCTEARRKYLKLGVEIGNVPPEHRAGMEHTHSKLGIFLSEVLGVDWTEWITGDPDRELREAGL